MRYCLPQACRARGRSDVGWGRPDVQMGQLSPADSAVRAVTKIRNHIRVRPLALVASLPLLPTP